MIEVSCPHCGGLVIIQAVNCAIFRHGVYKHNNKQIPPHLPKIECDKLVEENAVWGCGKPFKYANKSAIKCDYI